MTTRNGTENDDIFLVTPAVAPQDGDIYNGLGGFDTIDLDQNVQLVDFSSTQWNSIEGLKFNSIQDDIFGFQFVTLNLEQFAGLTTVTGGDGEDDLIVEVSGGTSVNLSTLGVEFIGFTENFGNILADYLQIKALDDLDYIFSASAGPQVNVIFIGQGGNDRLTGGDYNDIFIPNGGVDFVDGGGGFDDIRYTNLYNFGDSFEQSGDIIDGGDDIDTLTILGYITVGAVANIENIYFDMPSLGQTIPGKQILPNLLSFTASLAPGLLSAHLVGMGGLNIFADQGTLDLRTLSFARDAEISIAITGDAFTDDVIKGSRVNDTIDGAGGNDTLDGRAGNDVLIGGTGNDHLVGGSGRDTFYDSDAFAQGRYANGTPGNDVLEGGTGNDSYYVENTAGVTILELAGQGTDHVYAFSDYTLPDNVEYLTLLPPAYNNGAPGSVDLLAVFGGGNALDNRLFGNALGNLMLGYNGNDLLRGGDGADDLCGCNGDDIVYGDNGDDQLDGRNGDDVIIGGAGRDLMNGGRGADRYQFDDRDFAGITANTADVIYAFSHAEGDIIDLMRVDAVRGGADNGFSFIGSDAFHGVAGELRYQNVGTYTLVTGDVNGDGVADFMIRLSGTLTLTDTDFLL